ncbi:MAG: hypothetical protein OSA89_18440 [Mariniblastus sp.]|nr:hypothetical protein [Mariniblastus sp.]
MKKKLPKLDALTDNMRDYANYSILWDAHVVNLGRITQRIGILIIKA